LIAVLEEFGRVEPRNVIVIWQDENDDVCWSRAHCGVVSSVGMLKVVMKRILRSWNQAEDEG
jgi:hypothetical protein